MTVRSGSPSEYSLLGKIQGAEKAFLRGRRSRPEDLESVVTIFLEFLRGFESFEFDGPCVTVFGSSRFDEGHEYYELARITIRDCRPGALPLSRSGETLTEISQLADG